MYHTIIIRNNNYLRAHLDARVFLIQQFFFLYCIGDLLIQSGVKTILKKIKLTELCGNKLLLINYH